MPNPKLGTVTNDVVGAIKHLRQGTIEYRAEKQGLIHMAIGKCSFDMKSLMANFKAVIEAVGAAKPVESKIYWRRASIKAGGPAYFVNIDEAPFTSSLKK